MTGFHTWPGHELADSLTEESEIRLICWLGLRDKVVLGCPGLATVSAALKEVEGGSKRPFPKEATGGSGFGVDRIFPFRSPSSWPSRPCDFWCQMIISRIAAAVESLYQQAALSVGLRRAAI